MSVVVALSLLHFLWQGVAIGLAAWVGMKIARSAAARYATGVTALMVMAMAPVATATWIRSSVVQGPASWVQSKSWVQSPSESGVQSPESGTTDSTQSVSDPGPKNSGLTLDSGRWTLDYMRQSVSPSLAKLLLYSWLLGVGLLSVRLSLGLWTARRLTRLSVREPRPEILLNAQRLMAALSITGAVKVLESALVQVPTAMGWLKPVVLLPAQAMTGLSIAQIDALVAHELAHIKRHDYLVNLFQSAIETLLFYHPAVWLISRRVRHERELCCDDMAIAACGDDRLTYASALADLESLRQMPEPILAANGGSLLARVKRILTPDDVQTVRGTGHWLAGVAILLTVLIGAASQSVQGRQVVQGAQGVVGGIVNGVKDGVIGGIKGATLGGVVGGVKDGVAGGVTGGVEGGVLGSGDSADQQKVAAGETVRLEVTVTTSPKAAQRQADLLIATATAEWVKAQDAAAKSKAYADRLARVDLTTSNAVLEAAKTVPGLSTDMIVVSYLNQLEAQDKTRRQLKAANGYADGHPRILAIDSEVSSLHRQLNARIRSVIDTARLNAGVASDSAVRAKEFYDSVSANPSHGVTHTARDINLSKDYTVQEDGTILLPVAGKVNVAGLTVAALQESVRVALRAQGQPVLRVMASIEAQAIGPFRVGDDITIEIGRRSDPDWSALYATVDANGSVTVTNIGAVKIAGRTSDVIATEIAKAVSASLGGRQTVVDVRFDDRSSQNKSRTDRREGAPPRQLPATPAPEYKIQPLDVLEVTVTSGGQVQQEFRQQYGVQSDGSITLPLLGRVVVGAQTPNQTAKQIRDALILHRLFTEATVDVVAVVFHRTLTPDERALVERAPNDATGRAVKAQALYDNAYDDYAATRYDLAIVGFQTLLRTYPDEATSDRAQFFIGEAYYSSRRYNEAQAAYTTYIEKYQGTWWLADAYYKRALAYRQFGRTEQARSDFQFVVKNFPNNTLAPLAQVALAALPAAAQQQPQPPKQLPGYNIGPNDVIRVAVYSGGQSQPEFQLKDYTVQADGTVTLPKIKAVVVAGLSVRSAGAAILKALIESRTFDDANVDVTVMAYRSARINVMGAVNRPGRIDMTSDRMNLADALTAAGGLQPAAGSQIKVRHGAAPWEVFTRTDLNNGKLNDVKLVDGDTVDVPVAPKFFVQGVVMNPGESQWEENLTLERALLKVGGVTPDGAKNRIEVRRLDPKTKKYEAIKLDKDPLKTVILPQDVIVVPKRRL